MANRLAGASSPYLRQHAGNPVDWHEWGDAAFALARATDRPVFLSVGYASCHWCHVMAHESFEDTDVAAALNRDFVAVKVDREERPDVDAVYMTAVQALTGHGGWPMSVFLTPGGEPFFGGTYWPREPRQGMPGFLTVLDAVVGAWRDRREQLVASSAELATRLRRAQEVEAGSGRVDATVADRAAAHCVRVWDRIDGGFGQAPKFPQAMTIDFLLAHAERTGATQARQAAVHSLDTMTRGGIYDHLAGGFARYSTDARWLVPHFEKMLYDNALLLRALVHAWQVTAAPRFRRVAVETADYLVGGALRLPGGAFASSTDADSEGHEGRFAVWSDAELRSVVTAAGGDADRAAAFYGVTAAGSWEGTNVLHEPVAHDEDEVAALAGARAALLAARALRVQPALDDKVLTSWNALAIGALAEAGAVLGVPAYVAAAREALAFLTTELRVDGRWQHTWSAGHGASVPALLEDLAGLAQAALALFEADGDPAVLALARDLAGEVEARFADGDSGTYFATAHDAPALVARPKDLWDNAQPAGSSQMAEVHLRLAALDGDPAAAERAERVLAAFLPSADRAPTGFGELLRALERWAGDRREVAVVGAPDDPARAALVAVVRKRLRPAVVLAVGSPDPDGGGAVPLLRHRTLVDGRAAAYVCRDHACERPVTDPDALRALLDG